MLFTPMTLPAASGVYVLLVQLQEQPVSVGRLGPRLLSGGYYAYVGSALGGLRRRLLRYLKPQKKSHWHIDHLLTVGDLYTILWAETGQRQECQLAAGLGERLALVKGFGCSDCRCPSHLFFTSAPDELERQVLAAFAQAGLQAAVLSVTSPPVQDGLGQLDQ